VKRIAFCLLLPLLAWGLDALETEGGIESSPGVFLQVTSSPAARAGFNWSFTVPFMRGDGPLTAGNGVAVTPGLEFTPVDLNLTLNAVWTPIAFVEIAAGGRVGSGWSINLFGGDIHGMGLNLPARETREADVPGARHCGRAFDGALWQLRAGAALQGDVSAVFPGEWNRVVFRSFHEINYSAYTRARTGQAWFFENDLGENRNGFGYRGNLLVGYMPPLRLNTVGFMAEAERFLTALPDGDAWGDGLLRWTFSGVLGFTVTENLEAALIAQFRTRRNYVQENWEDMHFTLRTLDRSGSLRRLEWFRAVLALTYRF